MAFQKILVALDRSPQAAIVFEQALELAKPKNTQLKLFHALSWMAEEEAGPFIGTLADVDMYGTLRRVRRDRLQQEIEYVREWLRPFSEQAESQAISTTIDCCTGLPGSLICQSAQNWEADLIVLGRRGRRGLSEVLLGSVSNHVIHHAPCSVLVVQGTERKKAKREAMATPAKV
jgi:nucleotide-binding universal stress UspA family protein